MKNYFSAEEYLEDRLLAKHLSLFRQWHSGRSLLYKRKGESGDLFLLHCEVATTLWQTVIRLSGLSWVIPREVLDLLACQRDSLVVTTVRPCGKKLPRFLCLM